MVHRNVYDMFCTKFQLFSLSDLLITTITLNAKENFCMAAVLLLYIL